MGDKPYVYDDKAARNWFNFFKAHANSYHTRNILVLWGDDFAHVNATITMDNA